MHRFGEILSLFYCMFSPTERGPAPRLAEPAGVARGRTRPRCALQGKPSFQYHSDGSGLARE